MKNFDYLLTESKTDIEEFVEGKFADLYNWALERERQGVLILHHGSFWFPDGEVVIIYRGGDILVHHILNLKAGHLTRLLYVLIVNISRGYTMRSINLLFTNRLTNS